MITNPSAATTVTLPSDREIRITRAINAPRRLVFEAYTCPAHLPHWMLGPEGWTMPVCEVDLRPGGAWRFVWCRADGSELEMQGVYREIAPPERLVSTESWGGDWPDMLNTLLLSEEGGRTTITHQLLFPSQEARDAALRTGMQEGMSESFDRLEAYLARSAFSPDGQQLVSNGGRR
ncbi:MAG TPA: SRPBCC family protein [Roseiflexaceae bacterium]|nr:SRPBCC family protein [Roseiflexaceae bacterium]